MARHLPPAGLVPHIYEATGALGFSTLKSEQEEAIGQFLKGRDVFVALPTGYGKDSVYYSRLALARYGRIAAAKKKKAPAKLEEPSSIVTVYFVVVLSLLRTIYEIADEDPLISGDT